MVFFVVLEVLCRISRSSRMKPYGCSLDPISVPSLGVCLQRCCVVLCACCVKCCVVCSSLSMLGGWQGGVSEGGGGDKGAAPPRAQAPSPCRVGLAPFLVEPSSCDSSQLVHLLEELVERVSDVMDALVADEGREAALALLNICSHLFR